MWVEPGRGGEEEEGEEEEKGGGGEEEDGGGGLEVVGGMGVKGMGRGNKKQLFVYEYIPSHIYMVVILFVPSHI